jgi:hypothetical protein
MEMELSYNREVKSSYLAVCGYYPSSPNRYNVDTTDDEGYKARRDLFKEGKKVQFYTRLNADIFSSDLFMINNIAIEIEIHPHTSEFLLLDYSPDTVAGTTGTTAVVKPKYRLALTDLKLFCKYVELMDGVAMDIASRLESSPARYGIRRTEMRSFVITAGRYEFQTNLFTDQLPRRIIIVLVEPDAYNGSTKKSPWVFKHQNVREMSIISGGITWPAVLYNINWGNDQNTYMRLYNDMQESVGLANSLESNGISPAHFKNGWCFYCFNLTSDLEQHSSFELIKAGTTSVMIRFNEAVPAKGLNAIVLGEFDQLLMISGKERIVQSDAQLT